MNQLFASGGQSIGASTSASVFPVNIQGLLSFRIDWFDLFAVQGTLKSLIQYHSSKASILQRSAVSHPYMTIGKTIALNIWTLRPWGTKGGWISGEGPGRGQARPEGSACCSCPRAPPPLPSPRSHAEPSSRANPSQRPRASGRRRRREIGRAHV